MARYTLIELPSADSTNTYARNLSINPDDSTPLVIVTDNQTCGRGQRGNSWESHPGQNLTFSLVLYPRMFAPPRQFELSMLVSVGIVNALKKHIETTARVSIKWPNDIYIDDRKVAGILIENTLSPSCIEKSVIGIGINVNQQHFESGAPNPVSLVHVIGKETNLKQLLDNVVQAILDMYESYIDDPEPDELTYLYNTLLWRHDGRTYTWHDTASDTDFEATLIGVDCDGILSLKDTGGTIRHYLFKEVSAVL